LTASALTGSAGGVARSVATIDVRRSVACWPTIARWRIASAFGLTSANVVASGSALIRSA
jgi:hypothetical protein